MSLAAICQALQASRLGTALRESALMFPLIESAHVIGLSLSVGLIVLLDLRLVGAGLRHATPWQIMRQLKPWYLTGFACMFVTGSLLFWAEAASAYESTAFRWKVVFLLLAGLNAIVFEVLYKAGMPEWSAPDSIPQGARLVGWCSLICWAAVIGFGRWTAYRLGDRSPLRHTRGVPTDMMDLAAAIEASRIGELIRHSTWAFALGEVVHLFGLTLILGTTIVLNLRLFGMGLRLQAQGAVASDLRAWNGLGLLLSVVSGVVLAVSEPVKLAGSPPFAFKMVFFAAAVVYTAFVHRKVVRGGREPGFWAKSSAILSLMLWFSVAVAGRAIAFY